MKQSLTVFQWKLQKANIFQQLFLVANQYNITSFISVMKIYKCASYQFKMLIVPHDFKRRTVCQIILYSHQYVSHTSVNSKKQTVGRKKIFTAFI